MALSDLEVRRAKATGKAYTLRDMDGLFLAVTATGSKSWHFRYYFLGRAFPLGPVPFPLRDPLAFDPLEFRASWLMTPGSMRG
jgi:hypothetical protein